MSPQLKGQRTRFPSIHVCCHLVIDSPGIPILDLRPAKVKGVLTGKKWGQSQ